MSDDGPRDAGAAGWLSKAGDDLRVAEVILSGEIGVEWAACFHSQQAAEKALKGVLVHLGIDFPKSHSLDRLVALMPSDAAERFEPGRAHRAHAVGGSRPVSGRHREPVGCGGSSRDRACG